MRNLLLKFAIFAAAGNACAGLSVVGQMDTSFGKNETVGDTISSLHTGGDKLGAEGHATNFLGLHGSKDVGPGIQLRFALETGAIGSDGEINSGGAVFSQAAWLGLAGNFGEVRMGLQEDVPSQLMAEFDFNGASNSTSAQNLSMATPWSQSGTQSAVVHYLSPEYGGFSWQGSYKPASESQVAKSMPPVVSQSNYALGIKYQSGPLRMGVVSESSRSDADSDFYSAAGSYDFGVIKAEIGYADGGPEKAGFNIGLLVPIAGFKAGLTFAENNGSSRARAIEIYLSRTLWEDAEAYIEFANLSADTGEYKKGNAYAVGVNLKF
jgi:predicted porin